MSWLLMVLPQDLPQPCNPTELSLVPSQDAKSSISVEKKPVLPTHIHSQVCKFPNSHLTSFLQGTQDTGEQGPQRLHALSPAGDTRGARDPLRLQSPHAGGPILQPLAASKSSCRPLPTYTTFTRALQPLQKPFHEGLPEEQTL